MFELTEIANLTGGVLKGDGTIKVFVVVTDSRKVKPNSLFVAIKGEHLDGHDYVKEALGDGARAALVEKDTGDVPLVIVDNSISALGVLAHDYLSRLDVKKIGITGTNGKTTTKALIGSILKRKAATCVAEKSYNNAIGIPLTIFRIQADDRYLVLEYGTNHPGEIDGLLKIASPDCGVLTNIGPGHLEGFGSIEGVRKEKLRLLQAVDHDGLTVYPGDFDPEGVKANKITFGIGSGDIDGSDVVFDEDGSKFKVFNRQYRLRLLGRGNVLNSLAAIAIARTLEVDDQDIAAGLYECRPTSGRLILMKKDGVKILDDSYNSNPVSMREAVEVMGMIKAKRRIMVLGDMLELGPDAAKIHQDLGRDLKGRADLLITYGEIAENFIKGFESGRHFTEKGEIIDNLNRDIRPGDLILVKGSRRMAMEEIVRGLGV